MITVRIDHSYEDDYFSIAMIEVDFDDKKEEQRIKELLGKNNFQGELLDDPSEAKHIVANELKVDISLIDLDVDEIDLY